VSHSVPLTLPELHDGHEVPRHGGSSEAPEDVGDLSAYPCCARRRDEQADERRPQAEPRGEARLRVMRLQSAEVVSVGVKGP
jgi:hypothetical protein